MTTRAAAHGRVNLIGEHTDYNGGFVLPTTIPQQTLVELSPRQDSTVHAHSTAAHEPATYTLGREEPRKQWVDYLQGLTWALREAGYALPSGFELSITSEVPLGAGLSSSAALEVAVLRAIRAEFDLDIDDVGLARLGQRAENDFVGARSGIMDQMAASLAEAGSALFLDTRTLDFRNVPLPADAALVVIDSGVSHAIAGGDYNTRRAECEHAARLLSAPQLRDVTIDDLQRVMALPEPLNRRARHVVTEDARVLEAVVAMEANDLGELGRLFNASHVSMRDDFEVSVPEVDLLVDLAQADPDVHGARLTGGGFGGSVVILARRGHAREVARRVADAYALRSAARPTILVPI